jgi:hypothetical protein
MASLFFIPPFYLDGHAIECEIETLHERDGDREVTNWDIASVRLLKGEQSRRLNWRKLNRETRRQIQALAQKQVDSLSTF